VGTTIKGDEEGEKSLLSQNNGCRKDQELGDANQANFSVLLRAFLVFINNRLLYLFPIAMVIN
jgi:hypothetical protein